MNPQQLHLDSPANPRIKALVKLRDARPRRRQNQTVIEGAREVERAFEAGHRILELYIGVGIADATISAQLRARADAAGAYVVTLGPDAFAKASYRDHPDGILALAAGIAAELEPMLARRPELIVVAESVEKPGNLGAMLRTLDGAGAAMIVCDPATDLGNPNVIRASTGAVFTVPLAVADTPDAIAALKSAGYRIVATAPEAELEYWDAELTGKLAIVVGNEAKGLSKRWREAADTVVAIPMRGAADSLNAAQAATLLVYEALRQRRSGQQQL